MERAGGCPTAAMVKSCIDELKEKHSNWSSSQIAHAIGMGRSTFNRLENGIGKPSFHSVMKLLLAVGKTCKISGILETVDKKDVDTVKKDLSLAHIDGSVLLGQLAEYFGSKDSRMVMLLATTGLKGTSRKEAAEQYGNQGLKVLEELLDAGVLEESDAGIKGRDYDGRDPFIIDQGLFKNLLVDCLKEKYDPAKSGSGENWLSFQTEGVDKKKVIGLVRSSLKRAYEEIEEIIRSDEFRGDDKIFVGMVTDSLLTENVSQNNEKKEVLR